MRTIPANLLAKLTDRFKSVGLDNDPHIRLVATQTSTNTLLTEPIHRNTTANFGDVCVRQMAGEGDLSLAYAICIDSGTAKVYSRHFPASMDYPWNFVFSAGTASEVAIEYDGVWTFDEEEEKYYLQTEEFPYVFTVQQGILYVQEWNDSDNKIQLASGVTQISAIRGWTSSVTPADDQGLIVAYLKSGSIYYRNFAWSDVSQEKVWETEQQVTALGSDNVSISLFRTNDFRVGFLTEDGDGEINFALTARTYAGMSVPPEGVYCGTSSATVSYLSVDFLTNSAKAENVSCQTTEALFLLDGATDSRITATNVVRTYDADVTYCTGCVITLSHPLITQTLPSAFVSGITTSVSSSVSVESATYQPSAQTITVVFDWGTHTQTLLPGAFTVTLPINTAVRYYAREQQEWYFDRTVTGTAEEATNPIANTAKAEYVTAQTTSATVNLHAVTFIANSAKAENVTCRTSAATITYVPTGDIPV